MLLPMNDLIENIKFRFSIKSQRELAKILEVSEGLITQWKKSESKPSLDILNYIIEKTGCSWDELLTGRKTTGSNNQSELLVAKDEIISGLKRENELLREKVAILEGAGASSTVYEQSNKRDESAG